VNEALQLLFGGTGTSTTPDTTPTPTTGDSTIQQLLDQAAAKFNQADAALRNGDLGTYQTLVKQAQDLVAQAQAKLKGTSTPSTAAPTTTAPTTPTTKPAASALQAAAKR
jgi:hypothetical protein